MKYIATLLGIFLLSACTPQYQYQYQPSPIELAASTEKWWIEKCYNLKKTDKVKKWANVSDCLEENLLPIYKSVNNDLLVIGHANLNETRSIHEKLDNNKISLKEAAVLLTRADTKAAKALSNIFHTNLVGAESYQQALQRNTELLQQEHYQASLSGYHPLDVTYNNYSSALPENYRALNLPSPYNSSYNSPNYGGGCGENGSCYGDISGITGLPKTTYVRGYHRRDGTYVRSHYRSRR